jgi:hypothetical protein
MMDILERYHGSRHNTGDACSTAPAPVKHCHLFGEKDVNKSRPDNEEQARQPQAISTAKNENKANPLIQH